MKKRSWSRLLLSCLCTVLLLTPARAAGDGALILSYD